MKSLHRIKFPWTIYVVETRFLICNVLSNSNEVDCPLKRSLLKYTCARSRVL